MFELRSINKYHCNGEDSCYMNGSIQEAFKGILLEIFFSGVSCFFVSLLF